MEETSGLPASTRIPGAGKDEERSLDKPSKRGRNLAGGTSKAKQVCNLLLVVVPSLWPLCDPLDRSSHQRLGDLTANKG